MKKKGTKMASPASTGDAGGNFETNVQAFFVLLMLAGGRAPGMIFPITEIILQAKSDGYATDDMVVFTEDPGSRSKQKMLAQIKRSIGITKGDEEFQKVIAAAWEDFNNPNPKIYKQGSDVIALITGPLRVVDIKHTRTILDWAKTEVSTTRFLNRVATKDSSSDDKREKLAVFRALLDRAQQTGKVTNDALFKFMKDFHLISYDWDMSNMSASIVLSFAHSLIAQYSDDVAGVWGRLSDLAGGFNQNGGAINLDIIPPDLRKIFEKPRRVRIQVATKSVELPADSSQHEYASALALANLLGSWDGNNSADCKAVEQVLQQVAQEDYSTWIKKIQYALQYWGDFIVLQNGKWHITKREELWKALGSRIYDQHIGAFKKCAVSVLSERDPQFELPAGERFAAIAHGKVLAHSPQLRVGLAESLALLGNQSDALKNCSREVKYIARTAIREILHDADWVLWGSLNSVIPTLAEAAPDEFLDAIDTAARRSPSPFQKLFSEEGSGGVFGRNYLTEILWGLERIAWEEEYLPRVCVVLGELAAQDPGGNWVNRPQHSLWTILLPWNPQTTADDAKRKAVFKALKRRTPEVAWSLALGLLPNDRQHMMETQKPIWRKTVPADWKRTVTWGDVDSYEEFHAEIVVDMAKGDMQKLEALVEEFGLLSAPILEKILAHMSSGEITGKSDSERFPLWEKLENFVKIEKRGRRLPAATTRKVAAVADALSPKDPIYLHKRLFRDNEIALFDDRKNWKAEHAKLARQRRRIVKEILADGGINAALQFAETIEAPWRVGVALGPIANKTHEAQILPALLDADKKSLTDIALNYVASRYHHRGWEWVDGMNMENWSDLQKALFLSALPSARETWNRVANWLPTAEHEYWTRAHKRVDGENDDVIFAIDKLHEHKQDHTAIFLLDIISQDQPLDHSRCVRILLGLADTHENPSKETVMTVEHFIRVLQEDKDTNLSDLAKIEWKYLPLLASPGRLPARGLNKYMALHPEFFCEVIRAIFRSTNAATVKKDRSEREKERATMAYRLLRAWRTPPGTLADGTFSKTQFKKWLKDAKKSITASGHVDVSLPQIGSVLFYTPEDPNGLWVDAAVAEELDSADNEKMRTGFYRAAYSSRGVHTVDPSGSQERELAEKWREKANQLDNAGFPRFAGKIRSLAESYDHEAERVIQMAKEREERDKRDK